MPAGRGDDAERFAAALEQGRPPHSAADADQARDLEIVAALRASAADYAPQPDPDAKARARARLMAMSVPIMDEVSSTTPRGRSAAQRDESATEVTARIAPVIDTDAADDESADSAAHLPTRTRSARRAGRHTLPSRPGRSAGSERPGSRPGSRRSLLRRALVTGSAALLAVVVLGGGGMFASRDALPGDTLYGVKRVAETAELALTFDDAARASRHLELASTRLSEVEQLTGSERAVPADPELVESVIQDFDSATGEGSKMYLTESAAHDAARLADLQAWAADQVSVLSIMRSSLPAEARSEADRSIELLDRMRERAAELEARSSCSEVTSGESDEVGPLPSTAECEPASSSDDTEPTDENDPTGSSSPSTSSDPSGSATPGPDGLLPEVLGSPSSTPGADDETGTTTTTGSVVPSSSSVSLPLPLPLLPPISLPPLLPGGRGITIG